MPDDPTTVAPADTPTVEPDISTHDAPETQAADTNAQPEQPKYDWGDETTDHGTDEAAETTNSKPKTKPDKPGKPDTEQDTPDVPEDYLLDDQFDEDDPDVGEKIREANRGITRKFAKLDADYKARVKALTQREAAIADRERIADEHEALFLETLTGNKSIKDADLQKLIDMHPKGKEFREALSQQARYVAHLEAHVAASELMTAMRGLGWADADTQKYFEADPARLAKVQKYLSEGEPMETILKLVGVTDRRKSFKAPRPDSARETGNHRPRYTWS